MLKADFAVAGVPTAISVKALDLAFSTTIIFGLTFATY
ncbi:hypothetical protein CCP3SC15_230025 [Gammaproteobacteria bacterium]